MERPGSTSQTPPQHHLINRTSTRPNLKCFSPGPWNDLSLPRRPRHPPTPLKSIEPCTRPNPKYFSLGPWNDQATTWPYPGPALPRFRVESGSAAHCPRPKTWTGPPSRTCDTQKWPTHIIHHRTNGWFFEPSCSWLEEEATSPRCVGFFALIIQCNHSKLPHQKNIVVHNKLPDALSPTSKIQTVASSWDQMSSNFNQFWSSETHSFAKLSKFLSHQTLSMIAHSNNIHL